MSWSETEESPSGSQAHMFRAGADYPWWAAEEEATLNRTQLCQDPIPEYEIHTSIVCGMFLVFGIVYSLFGYRCFKAVMFLTGFIFACVVVYLICLSEDLLPPIGNAGVAFGAGVMFGLITMLVQYVGLFMTGFHTGLFLGVAGVAAAYPWWIPPNIWAVVGILLATGLLFAILTLYFQKGLTVLGTAVSGGAIMAASLDYFVEDFLMVEWFKERLMGEKEEEGDEPCWFSWFLLAVWPFMVLVGTLTQWRISGKGIYHQRMVPSAKSRNVNLQRIRSREARAEMRQKKYRYLYQVRTAHGDIISQEYIQSLQRKAYPACDNGTLQSDSTHTTMLPPDHSQLVPLTESEDEAFSPSVLRDQEEAMGSTQASHGRMSYGDCDSSEASPSTHHQRDYRFSSHQNLHPTPPPSPVTPSTDSPTPESSSIRLHLQ